MTEFLERGAEHFHLGIDGWQVSSASLQKARSLLTRERSDDKFPFAFSGKGKVFPPGKRGGKARSLLTRKQAAGRFLFVHLEKAWSLLTRKRTADRFPLAFTGKARVFPPGKRKEKAWSLFTEMGREKARTESSHSETGS